MHLYDKPIYHWSETAPYTCTATLTCFAPDCPEATTTLPCTVSSQRIAPTCTEDGAVIYTASFRLDGGTLTNPEAKSTILPKTGHTFTQVSLTKAEPDLAGLIVWECDYCGEQKTASIAAPETVTLSRTSYSYNGKAKNPSVTVTDSAGSVISPSNYTVTRSASTAVGTHFVSITFQGSQYSGTLSQAASFKIVPRSTQLKKLKARSKGFSAVWKARKTQVTGYQISYASNKKFSNAKTKKFKKTSITSTVISKLSAKKTYYVRIRTYKKVTTNGVSKTYYSTWSPVQKIKTKA
jgi:hypothetical protein